jgi:hypothetical protein
VLVARLLGLCGPVVAELSVDPLFKGKAAVYLRTQTHTNPVRTWLLMHAMVELMVYFRLAESAGHQQGKTPQSRHPCMVAAWLNPLPTVAAAHACNVVLGTASIECNQQ